MKAVILAAGVSSRLRPLTDRCPKCLLDVGGKTILGRTLEGLLANGIKECVIVTGYLEEMIREYAVREYPQISIEFLSNAEYAATNNIYSLWLTEEHVADQDILLLDSDIIFDSTIIELLLQSAHRNCLAIATGKTLGPEEIKVRLDNEGVLLEISKEVPPDQAAGESIGIEKFDRAFVRDLFAVLHRKIDLENGANLFYEAAFQDMIDAGQTIAAVDVGELPCMEIDTADDLESARALVGTFAAKITGNR